MERPNSICSPKHLPNIQATEMGNLDKNRNNKNSTQPIPDTRADKEYETGTPESLHIYNTDTTYPIFAAN